MTTTGTGMGILESEAPLNGRTAVDAFEAFLNPETDDQGPEAPAEGEELEATAEGEPTEEELLADDPEHPADEEEAEEAPPVPEVFTVKVDGKDVQVTKDELLAGYSRQADYTRKTQELAEQRKADAAEREQARAERAEYATLLPRLRAALEGGLGPEPNWAQLRQEDPVRASLLWQQREDAKRALEKVQAEEQRVQAQQTREEQEALERKLVEERNTLLEKLPEWRDDKVRSADVNEIRAALESIGYQDGELDLTDHRTVILARKAAKYDALMAKKPELERKRAAAPVVKPGGGVPRRASEIDRANARLAKSGSVKDAARVFEAYL